MKKACSLLLCLALALAAPLSALAEPQSWLTPFIKRGDSVKSGEAVMTVQIDPEAVLAVIDWYFDLQLKSYEELAKSWSAYYEEQYEEQEEEPDETDYFDSFYDSYIKSAKQSLNAARASAKIYAPAAAILADASEITVRSGKGFSSYEFRVNGNSWFTLNLTVRPEEGDVLLTSDLFPSCALSIPQRFSSSDASGEAVYKLLGLWQELLPALPEYEGFDLLGQMYEADVQALHLLEAEGLAQREGDALVYEHSVSRPGVYDAIPDETEDALYQRRAMDVDGRVYRLYDLTAPLRTGESTPDFWEEEGASDTLPVLGEDPTDEEYWNAYSEYMRLMYRNRTQTTTQTRRVVLENGEITNETTVTASTHYEPLADETGTIEKLREHVSYFSDYEDYEDVTRYVSRLTPTTYENRRMPSDYREEVLLLDTGAENEILFTYTTIYHNSVSEDTETTTTAELLLTRTDEGQQWTLTIPMVMGMLMDGGDSEEPIRATLSLDNDLNWMDLSLSMLGRKLGSTRAEYAYSEEPADIPDVSGLTVVPYSDSEAMQTLSAELRTIGIPKLTRLITTGMPVGAEGLIVPLLGLLTSLAQLGL
ncbi:MAG: hypothetical protein IKO52_15495 [Clostridia bacterium]|nr:hypothetical protein [Clostridia bacterium]